jgi:hypothetical protein
MLPFRLRAHIYSGFRLFVAFLNGNQTLCSGLVRDLNGTPPEIPEQVSQQYRKCVGESGVRSGEPMVYRLKKFLPVNQRFRD